MMRASILAAMPAIILAAGCANLSDKIDGRMSEGRSRLERMVKDVGQVEAHVKSPATLQKESGTWLGKETVALPPQDNLPPVFSQPATFDRTVYSLAELAERITLRSGVPTKVAPDAILAANRTLNPGAGNGTAQAANIAALGSAPPAPATAMTGNGASMASAHNNAVRIVYPTGTLKGLLDTAAARFGVFWKYSNATIQFYYTDRRTFQINAIPGDSALTATVASGSNSGANQSGSTGAGSQNNTTSNNSQNTAVKSQLSVFSSIEKSIMAMLSPYGKVVASPATGTMTVVDTPDILDGIAEFVASENRALSRQVMINVTVLAVNISEGDSLGINWNLVYGDLMRNFGVRNTVAAQPNSNSFSAGILNTANSKWSGSSLVIDALATQGRVRRETSASVVTLNNQPVPVQVAKQTTYLRSSQTTITANVGSTTTLDPGTVTSGFNMTILPHVLDDDTVMLQFSTDMSSLRQIRTVSSNSASIESPEVDTRNFLQRIAMKSNETLIISGFEQTDDNLERQGTGKPNNYVFGGGYKAQSDKEIIVILITPVSMGGV
jgi:type IVB pilus formation R64 PilN family outer membrane protein